MMIKDLDKWEDSYMKKIDFEAHFFTKEYLAALSKNEDAPRFTEGNQEQSHRLMIRINAYNFWKDCPYKVRKKIRSTMGMRPNSELSPRWGEYEAVILNITGSSPTL